MSSSLASLPLVSAVSGAESDADVKESVRGAAARTTSASAVSAGSLSTFGAGSERVAALLERLVDRVERLEASRESTSRSVRERPPTPALPAASSAAAVSLGLSAGHSGPRSMSAYLSGGARRVPIASSSAAAQNARVSGMDQDSDSDEDLDMDQPNAPAAQPTVSQTVREHPLFVPLAPSIIQDVGKAGFQAWMRAEAPKEEWTKLRNRNECEVLAQVLDALVLDHDSTAAIEILARRFVGVKHADKSGNWHFADVLAKDMPKRTLLRPSVLSSVLREAKNLTLLENGGYNRAGGGSGSGNGSAAGRNDRGGRDGDRQSFRGGRNDFRARGGRSAQPNSGGGGGYGNGGNGGDRRQNANNSSNATSNSGPSSAAGSAAASQNTGRGGQGQ